VSTLNSTSRWFTEHCTNHSVLFIANLPSKVLQSQTDLNRTGVYYGFARILPQDPDDPNLVALGEEQDADFAPSSSHSGSYDADSQERNQYEEDPRDDEWDVDEDEVVLGASPLPEGEMDLRETDDRKLSTEGMRVKSRQMSRSSARSARSLSTLCDKGNDLKLDKFSSTQNQSGQHASSTNTSSDSTNEIASSITSTAPPGVDSSATSADSHGRGLSNASSHSSARRHKKQRVAIAEADQQVFPMVMSIGWNPFYKNTTKTAEVHIMHDFPSDFYGLEMRVVILGYIRPEFNYVSKEALVDDIDMDKRVAINSLARSLYQDYATDPFLQAPSS
jgi:riboflavin kinase